MTVAERAACFRQALGNRDADPTIARRYSMVAAKFEYLRLARELGKTTPGDDARYAELLSVLKALTAELGLPACDESRGDAIAGVTTDAGIFPADLSRFFHDDWFSAARVWHGDL